MYWRHAQNLTLAGDGIIQVKQSMQRDSAQKREGERERARASERETERQRQRETEREREREREICCMHVSMDACTPTYKKYRIRTSHTLVHTYTHACACM